MAMIFYVATAEHLYTINSYLEQWGKDLRGEVEPIAYADLLRRENLPRAVYVFSDMDRVPAPMAMRAAARWERLASALPPGALLNHPVRSMQRFELLRSLYDAGINRFDAMRATEPRRPTRFPVFVRRESGFIAEGKEPRVFNDAAALQAGLRRAADAGIDLRGMIIVEQLDTAGAGGIHRKYGAFYVAGRVIPRHLMFSRSWVVKVADLLDPALLAEERRFIETNPHAEQIGRMFSIARIDYGRIDYWIDGDARMQVWEINTNPIIVNDTYTDPARAALARGFAQVFNAALLDQARCLDS